MLGILLLIALSVQSSVQNHGSGRINCDANQVCQSCSCTVGYRRNIWGKCVSITAECEGDPNAVLTDCSGPCPETCDTRYKHHCHDKCTSNKICNCLKGFVKGPDGRCIRRSECPEPYKCGENEILSNASEYTCDEIEAGIIMDLNPENTVKNCYCKNEYARDESGRCVPFEQCCTEPNSNLAKRVSRCPGNTCDQPEFSPCFTADYDYKCRCNSGYLRASETNKTCVHQSSCTNQYLPPK